MRIAVGAERGGRGGHHRLELRVDPLQGGDGPECPGVSDTGQRQHRIILQRPERARHHHQRVERVGGPAVPERLDHRAAEEVDAPVDVGQQPFTHHRVVVERGQRPYQRRANELGGLGVERLEKAGRHRRVRLVLEIAVGHRPQSVVLVVQHVEHRRLRRRAAEAHQQHQGAIPHVAVLVGGDRRGQRRLGLLDRGPSNLTARLRPHLEIEIAKLADRRLEGRRLLRGCPERAQRQPRHRDRENSGSGHRLSGNFSAICMYASESSGEATGYSPV